MEEEVEEEVEEEEDEEEEEERESLKKLGIWPEVQDPPSRNKKMVPNQPEMALCTFLVEVINSPPTPTKQGVIKTEILNKNLGWLQTPPPHIGPILGVRWK